MSIFFKLPMQDVIKSAMGFLKKEFKALERPKSRKNPLNPLTGFHIPHYN